MSWEVTVITVNTPTGEHEVKDFHDNDDVEACIREATNKFSNWTSVVVVVLKGD